MKQKLKIARLFGKSLKLPENKQIFKMEASLKTYEYTLNKLPQDDPDVRFFDIAANLSHQNFQGIYSDKKYHDEDLEEVIQRSLDFRVDKMLVVGGYLEDIERCKEIVQDREGFWTTVGVHPCKAGVNFNF